MNQKGKSIGHAAEGWRVPKLLLAGALPPLLYATWLSVLAHRSPAPEEILVVLGLSLLAMSLAMAIWAKRDHVLVLAQAGLASLGLLFMVMPVVMQRVM
jgi:hypothetical protein